MHFDKIYVQKLKGDIILADTVHIVLCCEHEISDLIWTSTIGETDTNRDLILCTNPSIILICTS